MKYMPTVKCPRCETEFSAMLAECPHCGKRRTMETDKDFAIPSDAGVKPVAETEEKPQASGERTAKGKAPGWQNIVGVLLIVIGLVSAGLACFALGREQSVKAAVTPPPEVTAAPLPTPTPTPTVNSLSLFSFDRELTEGFTAYVGDTVTLSVKSDPELEQARFTWSISDAESARLTVSKDTDSCEFTALKPSGKNSLTVSCYGVEYTIPVYLWNKD